VLCGDAVHRACVSGGWDGEGREKESF